MKIAYVHVLPLEYYPPAQNALRLLSEQSGWTVRAWTSAGTRGHAEWKHSGVSISRPRFPASDSMVPWRMTGYLAWHMRAAIALAAWKPDVVISVEPHSTLAVWLYYKFFRGAAKLFVHHHEYYAPEDFEAEGMRLLRATRKLEQGDLFPHAMWVSQTNDERLRLLLDRNPSIRRQTARTLPNYPPRAWIAAARSITRPSATGALRIVYVGAASFEDTFIREAVEWAAEHSGKVLLHVCGENVRPEVAEWIRSLNCPGVTVDDTGKPYEQLPSLLRQFDVGLVLYRGNTLNFVHNVPNKSVEYLACGLQVWYPGVMKGMTRFHQIHPHEDLREMDFINLPLVPPTVTPRSENEEFEFTAEAALAPLLSALRLLDAKSR